MIIAKKSQKEIEKTESVLTAPCKRKFFLNLKPNLQKQKQPNTQQMLWFPAKTGSSKAAKSIKGAKKKQKLMPKRAFAN